MDAEKTWYAPIFLKQLYSPKYDFDIYIYNIGIQLENTPMIIIMNWSHYDHELIQLDPKKSCHAMALYIDNPMIIPWSSHDHLIIIS